MKDAKLLIWITQLGLSTAAPLAGFTLMGVWLYKRYQFGLWIIVVGVLLGILCGISGLRSSLKAMERMTEKKEKEPFAGFNDHE